MATGLIDVGIIKPELAGSFAAGYRGAEQARQKAGLVQQETEMNQMKLEQLKQDRASLLQLQDSLKAAGKDPDPIKVFDALIATGKPDYVMKGIDGKRRLTELQRADRMLRQFAPELFDAEPTNAMAPAAPAGASMFDMPAGAQPSGDYTSTQAMGRVPGVVTTPIPESPPMNAMAPAAAPVNAMAPTAAPAADVNALRRQLVALSSIDDPRAKALAEVIKGQITEASKPYVVAGRLVTGGGKELYAAPDKPTELQRNFEFAKTPAGGNFKGSFADFKVLSAPKTTTNITNVQEKAFESGLGAGQSKRILDNQVAAQDAAEILRTNQVGRDLLEAGAITGTGADFLVGLNNALKQVGVDFGYADAAANSQAYVATLGANVGRIIKQFGAGTGLSDADRDFAEKIAGGKIALTETALRRILDINDRASNRVIDLHNKNVAGIKTNIPLTVEKPVFQRPPASAANQIPGNAPAPARAAPAAIPQAAIDALKAGRGTDAQFDAIFGPGAAKQARGR